MPNTSAVPTRRRVSQACDSCRILKAKCDGQRPVCGRCSGYSYACRWAHAHAHPRASKRRAAASEPGDDGDDGTSSHALLRRLRDRLSREDQALVDSVLTGVDRVSADLASASTPSATLPAARRLSTSSRYLGKASDVSFFNLVRGLLNSAGGRPEASQLESYEREVADELDVSQGREDLELPDREAADAYVNVYFSTIHAAYPFICRQQFAHDYHRFWEGSLSAIRLPVFRPLLLTVFAIGSYYNICSLSTQHTVDTMHAIYFRHALWDASRYDAERSIEIVCLLLAQCFYLLATCQTDRCWTTLGLAIRIGQSIGLHIEEAQAPNSSNGKRVAREIKRRTWYSAYVLDRLLSLQLGRPLAIRNRDCSTELPCRLGDEDFNVEGDAIPVAQADEREPGDYFLAVIKFSDIVGHVMRDLYRPNAADYSEAMLERTDALDVQLLDWRAQLPRWLRFDRGHTFENSALFKRQRNMLAMKFHHLRALIHRPYLCLPWLTRNDSNIKALLDESSRRVVYLETVCVMEAQETAHMLHDVVDKRSLVEDFPWWQMISCLICASSILLVMRAFSSPITAKDDLQMEMLEEDADTCLKVFDALSTNSDAARSARDMLRKLRRSRAHDAALSLDRSSGFWLTGSTESRSKRSLQVPSPQLTEEIGGPAQSNHQLLGNGDPANSAPLWHLEAWPSEMADSLAWSFQFFEPTDSADT